MKSVQYHHNIYQNRKNIPTWDKEFTAICIVPEKIDLLAAITTSLVQQVYVNISAGITFVSPKDQYNKTVGRTESLARCKTEPYKISVVDYVDDKITIQLDNVDENSRINIIFLEIKHGRHLVYFVDIHPNF